MIVTPGQLITEEADFMTGHGTKLYPITRSTEQTSSYLEDQMSTTSSHSSTSSPSPSSGMGIYSTLAGSVERINKLINVRSTRSRYGGSIGDVVIGRVTALEHKRWKLDINASQDASLLLSAINLPGGVQRRKQEHDELQMRNYFSEGEVLCAEVQAIHADGSIAVHARNDNKYGKLGNGQLVRTAGCALVPRARTHFLLLNAGLPAAVEVITGMNGYIWVGVPRNGLTLGSSHVGNTSVSANTLPFQTSTANSSVQYNPYARVQVPVSDDLRMTIARVANCILVLSQYGMAIGEESIMAAVKASMEFEVKHLQNSAISLLIAQSVKKALSL